MRIAFVYWHYNAWRWDSVHCKQLCYFFTLWKVTLQYKILSQVTRDKFKCYYNFLGSRKRTKVVFKLTFCTSLRINNTHCVYCFYGLSIFELPYKSEISCSVKDLQHQRAVVRWGHRRRIYTVEKAKVVAVVLGTEFIKFLATPAMLHYCRL